MRIHALRRALPAAGRCHRTIWLFGIPVAGNDFASAVSHPQSSSHLGHHQFSQLTFHSKSAVSLYIAVGIFLSIHQLVMLPVHCWLHCMDVVHQPQTNCKLTRAASCHVYFPCELPTLFQIYLSSILKPTTESGIPFQPKFPVNYSYRWSCPL